VASPKTIFSLWGNTLIDTLMKQRPNFKKPAIREELGLSPKNYTVMTLQQPANVDEEYKLKALTDEIISHSVDMPLVFPMHPELQLFLSV